MIQPNTFLSKALLKKIFFSLETQNIDKLGLDEKLTVFWSSVAENEKRKPIDFYEFYF